MSPVRIINASYVNVPATAALPPEPIKLTAMEALWVVIPLLQHVLLYEGANMPPFEDILESLRSSLAATLRSFAPLAGKLVYLEDTGNVGISCSASDGVRFVVAESDADISRLIEDEEHDLRVLELLVPEVDMNELPTAVLAVQATRFEGGVAVGVTVHHGVADGRSLWAFVEAWASACRGEIPAVTPCFDRSLVKLPAGEELASSILRKFAPNLPSVRFVPLFHNVRSQIGRVLQPPVPFIPCAHAPPPSSSYTVEDRTRFTRQTFTLDAQDIHRLKQRIVVHLGDAPPPSTFTAVAALAWTCYARCKPFAADDDVQLFFFADARGRLDPTVDAGYIGACITGCLARLPAHELRGERALAAATLAVQDEISKMKEDSVTGWNFFRPTLGIDIDRLANVSGSSGFRAYQIADFAWGMPRRTEPIRMDHDCQVAMMRVRDGHGVQVSVSLLHASQMDEFKSHFLMLLE